MGEKIQYSYIKPPSNSRGGGWGCLQNKQNRRRMTTYNCAPLRHPLLGDMLHGNLKSHRKEYNVSVNYRGHTSCFLTERTRELRNTPLSWRHMQDQNIDPPPRSRTYRCAVRKTVAGVHSSESATSQYGSHLVNLLERLLLHFNCKGGKQNKTGNVI